MEIDALGKGQKIKVANGINSINVSFQQEQQQPQVYGSITPTRISNKDFIYQDDFMKGQTYPRAGNN